MAETQSDPRAAAAAGTCPVGGRRQRPGAASRPEADTPRARRPTAGGIGILALLTGLAAIAGCSPRRPQPAAGAVALPNATPKLDGSRALAEVQGLLALGPRAAGEPGAERAATYLVERLRATGIEPLTDAFEEDTPAGRRTFRNVVGVVEGRRGGTLIVATHYDTKAGMPDGFQGANDSGSGTGLLLELARVLRAGPRPGRDVLLAFLDGEECLKTYGPNDGLHGSRRLAATLVRNQRHRRVAGVIVLDMVGDRDLTITLPANGDPALTRLALRAAADTGARKHFSLSSFVILDDHVPFLKNGMPAVDLIDFEYGPKPGSNAYWHSADDTLDKLSAESLQIVGNVVLRMLAILDGEAGRRP